MSTGTAPIWTAKSRFSPVCIRLDLTETQVALCLCCGLKDDKIAQLVGLPPEQTRQVTHTVLLKAGVRREDAPFALNAALRAHFDPPASPDPEVPQPINGYPCHVLVLYKPVNHLTIPLWINVQNQLQMDQLILQVMRLNHNDTTCEYFTCEPASRRWLPATADILEQALQILQG